MSCFHDGQFNETHCSPKNERKENKTKQSEEEIKIEIDACRKFDGGEGRKLWSFEIYAISSFLQKRKFVSSLWDKT